ncbi:MAG: alpha/beta fold hydrolase [Elusimicrobiales bacterium]|nr:alpha/beta fold hydrolase [Elusimicrobiales bacterium]
MKPASGALVFVNVHGLGSDKNEWGGFQKDLAARGYGWLSIDLRGHGGSRSCGGKKADYRTFTKADWAAASRDIEAAAGWLKKKKISKMVFCGASVGANLALKAAAEGTVKPAAVVLLSPGLDYAGVKPEFYLAKAPKRLLFAAAEDDPYAWQSAAALSRLAARSGLSASAVDGGSGHGVNMFKSPATADKVLDWAGRLP